MARTYKDRPFAVRRSTPAVETRPRARERRGRIAISDPPPRAHRADAHTDTVYSPVERGPVCDCAYFFFSGRGPHRHRFRSHIGHDKLNCEEDCELALHFEVRDYRPRFHVHITARDIHNAWTVPDRAHSRAVLGRLTRATRALETLNDLDELDDSEVQPRAHSHNEMWGGGYFD